MLTLGLACSSEPSVDIRVLARADGKHRDPDRRDISLHTELVNKSDHRKWVLVPGSTDTTPAGELVDVYSNASRPQELTLFGTGQTAFVIEAQQSLDAHWSVIDHQPWAKDVSVTIVDNATAADGTSLDEVYAALQSMPYGDDGGRTWRPSRPGDWTWSGAEHVAVRLPPPPEKEGFPEDF